MTMKRMISLCLSLLLLTGAAFAAEAPISLAPSYEINPITDRTLVRVWGTAVAVEEDRARLNNSNEEDPYSDIVHSGNGYTRWLDAVPGDERAFGEV